MKRKIIILLLCLVIIVSGCNSTQLETATLTPSSVIKLTPEPSLPAKTSIPTWTPTHTLLPTKTPLPPTLTPIPTLNSEQALLEVSNLLSANPDGCQLPCFWHVTPGKTSWDEASNILRSFSDRDYVNGNEDKFLAEYFYTVPNDDWWQDVRLFIRDDTVESIETKNIDSILYSLINVLDVYGSPDEVWIMTFRSASYSQDNTVPFMVFLLYSKFQFIVSYELIDGAVANDQVMGCVSGDPSIYIWSSQDLIEIQDILEYFNYYFPDQIYLRLSDATEGKLNENDFYSLFRNPNNEACINTPADFWPDL